MVFGAELTDARRYATIARNGKGKKIRRGKRSRRASCVSPKASFRKHKKFVPFDEVFVSMLILKSKKEPSKERPCSALIVYWRYKI